MTVLKTQSSKLSYDEAVKTLNSLQTNAITLKKTRRERQKNVHLNLPITRKFFERSGMTVEDLNKLKIVHVSGTKGKGSTCAFCESILRHSGFKTGFYSSPHLVSVTERIRINGKPIEQDKFTSHFWNVFDKVCKGYSEEDRPPYFKFLTILAFNIFFKEDVDVAIIEVGIGGEYDCTNIIEKPIVTGITSLGLDHTSLLGNSITDIAWHKAGIMKQDVVCYVDPFQKQEALDVVTKRGQDIQSHPILAPQLSDYSWPSGSAPKLGLYGEVQKHNASLALALANYFLLVTKQDLENNTKKITEEVVKGLELTEWPGRSQTVSRGQVEFYLDGAHTEESMESCVQWISEVGVKSPGNFRVLMFNMTGDREARSLLTPLSSLELDLVIFCTNTSRQSDSVDQQNYNTNYQMQLSRCDTHEHVWAELMRGRSNPIPCLTISCFDDAVTWVTSQHCPDLRREFYKSPNHQLPCLLERAEKIEVLVTGSLHLVGGVLGFIS